MEKLVVLNTIYNHIARIQISLTCVYETITCPCKSFYRYTIVRERTMFFGPLSAAVSDYWAKVGFDWLAWVVNLFYCLCFFSLQMVASKLLQ